MDLLRRISAIWQNISLIQRALLVAITLTLGIVAVLLTHWAGRPDMRLLYHDLSAEEASRIAEKINEQGVVYELRNGGTSIFVPKEKVYQLRLDMAKDGLPADSQGGYKIFDSEKIGVSPFVQSINLKRALEEELAKSIQMIEGVGRARVHIVNAKQTLFTSQAGKTTASVALRLRAGYRLSNGNIAAITHLVAGSVESLKAENVTVVDSTGRLLSRLNDEGGNHGASTVQDYKERVEDNYAAKIEDMLTAVLGPARAEVSVSAVIDMNSINLTTEIYEPDKRVASKEEIKSTSKTDGGSVGSGGTVVPGGVEKDETIVTDYMVGKTVRQEVVLPGKVSSLTVSAVVDLSVESVADANEGGSGAQAAKIMTVSDVEAIIQNALGLEDTTGIKVVDVPFHRPAEVDADETRGGLDFVAIAGQASLGIMAICALLVLKIFSGAGKKARMAVSAQGGMAGTKGAKGQLPGEYGTAALPGAEGERPEPLALRKEIAGALAKDPEQVKQLFSSWVEEVGV